MREPLLDPDEAVRRGQLVGEASRYERGDVDRALAEADVVVEAEYRTQTVLHNSIETHQSICEWRGDSLDVYISTQSIWGVRDEVADALGLAPDKVRVVCEFMGGGFGSKNGAGDHTYVAAELARRTGRPVRCALTRREENLAAGNRNSTIQRLTAAARSDGTLVALVGEFVNATGWSGWAALDGRADADALRLRERPHRPLAGQDQHAADEGVPRAGLRRGHVRARVPARRARGEAGPRPARDPAPELRALDRRPAVLVEEPDGVLQARRAALAAARRGAREERGAVEARRRAREPGLVRRRRAALLRVGAGRLRRARDRDHGDAGHRHRHCDGDGPDRRRGARAAARPRRLRARRLGARARTPSISAGSSTIPSMGPAVRSAAADAARQIIEIAAQRYDKEERVLSLAGRQGRLRRRRLVADRGGRRPARGRADPRQGRARPEPDRDAGAHLRRPGRRGRRRRRDRARSGSSASPRSTTSGA